MLSWRSLTISHKRLLIMVVVELSIGHSESTREGKTPSARRCWDKRIYLLRFPGKSLENERSEDQIYRNPKRKLLGIPVSQR